MNIPQALPEGEVGERKTQELVPAGEALDLVVALVAVDTLAKLVRGKSINQHNEFRRTHRTIEKVQYATSTTGGRVIDPHTHTLNRRKE